MEMERYPRVLVIANECISNASSNGRTLRNFLVGWPKECLAQFCIRNTEPDKTVCDNYYYVSDRDALNSFLKGKQAPGKMPKKDNQSEETVNCRRGRTPLTMLLRNLVWSSMRWAGNSFYHWVEAFSPEVILLQAGDCAFMLDLARKLTVKYGVPLVIYNSEAYYFKKYDYFRSNSVHRLFYPLFHRHFCISFEKCIRIATKSIYICDKLKTDYDAVFGLPSETIYTVTQLQPLDARTEEKKKLRIAYLGNLGVGRHESLVEIGVALQKLCSEWELEVYGKIPNPTVEEALNECPGIRYMGFISYEQVLRVMHTCDILVHAESFSDFYQEDLKYAFSTKIADCLASGQCFLLYAPSKMACTEYLKTHDAAFVVDAPEMLGKVLQALCTNETFRQTRIANALVLAKKNHNPQTNTLHFQQVLFDCAKKDPTATQNYTNKGG